MRTHDVRIRGSMMREALQQPEWHDLPQVRRVGEALRARPALVRAGELATLRGRLAEVARGEALVLQAGDCAEDPGECTREHVARKAALLDLLAGLLGGVTGKPVVCAGRIGGQFAKPRSRPTETVGGVELPVFRGHMVNGPEPDEESRRPDPLRILTGYMAARDIVEHLDRAEATAAGTAAEEVTAAGSTAAGATAPRRIWTSHEALLLDYELPMVRTDAAGRPFLGSTHWPWIGERTRQAEGAHVALLAQVGNPVACKVGPATAVDELLAVCRRLDPWREAGRLTLIARMGADLVAARLPRLVEAVRHAGHRAVWLSDPMHGNTVTAPSGHKTRLVGTVSREVARFVTAVRSAGGVPGGLHLETTPDEVTECAGTEADLDSVGERYTSHCDPRLNPSQAQTVVAAWTA
ncbi:3-deoxy-7-phosphoheptulonate synthase [Streptomyces cavernicola]|uniref:Phospho-2-dehydro-3-deoxyheptonate aldolase n=1 Tax=Streptomyces cavernicola TaxID=3043613 RepID=A0ABT6SP23_9ACTN|nr:3-deoxy-7-phosphoheptulonate synthase [Streptomyces sp. B-S-A6]MDI3409432.1 3-deoxy-7-phosphoheptulonate synthase [Streptomyces sp. B-S-A6]